ncbi:MAG: DUF2691 family protein [Bacillota bacterium]
MQSLRFEIPKKYGSYLQEILENISLEKYIWEFGSNEMLVQRGPNPGVLFKEGFYSGQEFREAIDFTEGHLLIWLYVRACPLGSECKDINTYGDFAKSDCEIVIEIDDSLYVNIYAKNPDILDIVKDNTKKHGFTNVEYFYPDNECEIFYKEDD